MEFAEFADRVAEIEAESADLGTVSLLASLFSDSETDLETVVRFVQGRVFPAWDSTTLDIGPRLCHEALARAAGPNVSADDVEDKLAELGEIGAVAASYDFGGQRGLAAFGAGGQDGLTVAELDSELRDLAAVSGAGSEDTKLKILYGLFNRTDPDEARYLARLVLSEMRIGVGEGSVRDAIAEAFLVDSDDAAAIRDDDEDDEAVAAARERRDGHIATVARALQVSNDYGMVAALARDEGADGLRSVHLEVGRPVQAMLAQAGTAADALEAWETVGVETKFDGARVQVHRDDEGTVSLYSRNMEDVTDALPEVVEYVEEAVDSPAILDGEVVALDDDGEPLPFQEILKRFRRKHDVAKMRDEIRVELRAFDCLHAMGEDLLNEPLTTRHEHLADVLGDDSKAVSDLLLSDDADEIAAYEADALEMGHEGIMLKNPDASYSPGDRGKNWLKRKPDVETLDLVVTGAEWGEGRRAKFLGTFLLSARNDGEYETLGKVATGITDDQLVELTELLEPEIERESGKEVDIRPSVVFEVGYEEIQESPTYSSGYALRFPRFISVREDKTAETADSLERVERLAESQ
ncbi:ATP-dependent DNA ligase LigA [Haloferax sp. DFSO60]|uniref:ATP-dependent DNA ligase LigA n=1 Tax=Haloferax sp. DFSO60 TaxID=3388652 RepID=UPI00397A35D2